MLQLIYKKFQFSLRKTNFKKEILGGLVTFFAMIYILPVNSEILSDNGKIMPYGGVFVATALVGALGSIIIGMFSNLPIGIAPGMGSNIFFVSTMIKQFNLSWEIALSIVIINGLIFTFLAIAGLLDKFIKAIPPSLKYAFVVSLGVYLAFIGMKEAGIASISSHGFKMGDLSKISTILSLLGIFLVFILAIVKIKMAILISLMTMSIIGLILGQSLENHELKGLSSFSDIKFDYSELNKFSKVFGKGITSIPNSFQQIKMYPSLLALIFMTISGSSGTIVSVIETSGLYKKNGKMQGSKKALISIGISSATAGIMGTSPAGGYLESNAGVAAGARTGFASIVVGVLFLLSIPLSPILQPLFNHQFVTAPILIFVGSMMMGHVKKVNWSSPTLSASSFILMIITWFTSSILNGIAFGIVAYSIFEICRGNWRKINIFMYVFSIMFLVYIITIPFLF